MYFFRRKWLVWKCLLARSSFHIIGQGTIRHFSSLRLVYTIKPRYSDLQTQFMQNVGAKRHVFLDRIERDCSFSISQGM